MMNRMTLRKFAWLFSLLFFLVLSSVRAQDTKDVNARSPNPIPMSRMEKQAQKKKVKQKELGEKAIAKGIKRHEKLQTRDVRKRMKKSKHLATANNAHKKEFFLKRWFQTKHKTKRR